ncbi:hypothetical protein BC940DRAFT_295251 [Gongronella butleri]|nr:hypothetical protein BC940DRAFT_295251 [Gongronella butleri]
MSFQLSNTWQALGPFPAGMREHDFGADPLEAYGGFQHLKFSKTAQYPSELGSKGSVGWSTVKAVPEHTVVPPFSDIAWQQMTGPFGWSMECYQAWFRGSLRVNATSRLLIQVHGAPVFFLDGKQYSGDFYGYKTTTHVVALEKGLHQIDVRLVNDVRVFGGARPHQQPDCRFSVTIRPLEGSTAVDDLLTGTAHARNMVKSTLLPSFLVQYGFAGVHGSVTLQNVLTVPFQVMSIRLIFNAYNSDMDVTTVLRPATLLQRSIHATLMSGQQRAIGFKYDLSNVKDPIFLHATTVHIKVIVSVATASSTFSLVDESRIPTIDWRVQLAFRYTFVDFDESVQYAYAKRPRTLTTDTDKPILLALHGAGVDAGSNFWTAAIAQQEQSWIVFPTGRTPWGYDWHGASMKNAFKAIDGLESVMSLVTASGTAGNGPDAISPTPAEEDTDWIVVERGNFISIGNKNRLIYIGHSNGGQGAWHLATHFPDRAIAVVAAAGYTKIQDYVSYANWVSKSYVDPFLYGVLESSIAEFNNDLHLSNMVGLPVLARYGADDDNVPPLHSKKYARILNQYNKNASFVQISEVPNQGHWWSTVLNDRPVNQFLTRSLQQPARHGPQDTPFSLVTTNPATIGPVHGIQIEQLSIPFRKSTMQGRVKDAMLYLSTENISAFRVVGRHEKAIMVNNTLFHNDSGHLNALFVMDQQQQWRIETQKWPKKGWRARQMYGPIHRLWESRKPLLLVTPSKPSSAAHAQVYEHLALQLAHDWHLYGHGDAMVVTDDHPLVTFEEVDLSSSGTSGMDAHEPCSWRVYFGIGTDNNAMAQILATAPIRIQAGKHSLTVGTNQYYDPGTGAMFLCPGGGNELALMIYGVDVQGLQLASQLIPKRTGMLMPEWAVINPVAKEQGLGGIKSAGFFHNNWEPFGY